MSEESNTRTTTKLDVPLKSGDISRAQNCLFWFSVSWRKSLVIFKSSFSIYLTVGKSEYIAFGL